RLYGIMIGVKGLHNGPAVRGVSSTACPPGYLHKQLHAALGRSKIGQEQTGVRADYPDERDTGNIETLGYHLGAHQDIRLAVGKHVHDPRVPAMPRGCVFVPPEHSRAWKERGYFIHHALS